MSGGASSGYQGPTRSTQKSIYNLGMSKSELGIDSKASNVLMQVARALKIPGDAFNPKDVGGGRTFQVSDVINAITSTTGALVIGVDEVENTWLKQNFWATSDIASEHSPEKPKHFKLYHGTAPTAAMARKLAENGFDPLAGKRSKYGRGIYGTDEFKTALLYAKQAAEPGVVQKGIYQFRNGKLFLLDNPEHNMEVHNSFFEEGVEYMQLLVVEYRVWCTGTKNGYTDAKELDIGLAFKVPEGAGDQGQILIIRNSCQTLVQSFIWFLAPLPQKNPPRSVLPANPFGGAGGSVMQPQLPQTSLFESHRQIVLTVQGTRYVFKVGSTVELDLYRFQVIKKGSANLPSNDLSATIKLLFKRVGGRKGEALIEMKHPPSNPTLVNFLSGYKKYNNGSQWKELITKDYNMLPRGCEFWIRIDLTRLKLVASSSVSTSQVAASGAPNNGAAAAGGSAEGKQQA